MTDSSSPIERLSKTEARRRAELEQVIERGLATFIEVGSALKEVRDERLYRSTHRTFEAYVNEVWDIERSRAYQLMEAAEMSKRLDIPGLSEGQTRELGVVYKEHGKEASRALMRKFEESGEKPTVSAIRTKVREKRAPAKPTPAPKPDRVAELEAENARLRAEVAEIPRLRARIAELEEQLAAALAAKPHLTPASAIPAPAPQGRDLAPKSGVICKHGSVEEFCKHEECRKRARDRLHGIRVR